MGKPWENGDLYGTSPFLVGKSTISMAIFYSYVNYQRVITINDHLVGFIPTHLKNMKVSWDDEIPN